MRALRLASLAWVTALASLSGAALPATAAAQTRLHRFVIDSVGDTTFVFRIGRQHDWVRAGLEGMAVDPQRRDALVARIVVLNVSQTRATALVTGQTTLVTRDHVAVIAEPPTRFYRARSFWAGTMLGGIVGAAAALLLTR